MADFAREAYNMYESSQGGGGGGGFGSLLQSFVGGGGGSGNSVTSLISMLQQGPTGQHKQAMPSDLHGIFDQLTSLRSSMLGQAQNVQQGGSADPNTLSDIRSQVANIESQQMPQALGYGGGSSGGHASTLQTMLQQVKGGLNHLDPSGSTIPQGNDFQGAASRSQQGWDQPPSYDAGSSGSGQQGNQTGYFDAYSQGGQQSNYGAPPSQYDNNYQQQGYYGGGGAPPQEQQGQYGAPQGERHHHHRPEY